MERAAEFVQLDERERKQIWWPERVASHAGEQIAANAVLGEIEGLSVILETVARGVADVAITLRCQRDEGTVALDAAHATAWATWQALAESGPPASEPPEMPGRSMLEIPVALSDDLGTRYAIHGRRGPGPGSEWQAELRFYPPVPAHARTLTVSLGDGHAQAQTIPL